MARLVAQLQLRRALRPEEHAPRSAARAERRHRRGRRRLRHAPAPRHGDRHVGARRRARAPRQRRQRRRHHARRRAAHERGHRHPPLRDERERRPSRCTCCRCGCRPTPTGIAPGYEQRDVSGEIKPDELFPLASGRETDAAIRIHQRDATLWIARLDRGLDGARSPTRRSCTCSSRAARRRSRRGRSSRATRSASPTPARSTLTAGRRHRARHLGDVVRPRRRLSYLTRRDNRRSASTLPPV